MTRAERDALKALCAKARPGPWSCDWDDESDDRTLGSYVELEDSHNSGWLLDRDGGILLGQSCYADDASCDIDTLVHEPSMRLAAAAGHAIPELLIHISRLEMAARIMLNAVRDSDYEGAFEARNALTDLLSK